MEQQYEQSHEGLPAANPMRDTAASAMQDMTKTDKDILKFRLFLLNQEFDEDGNAVDYTDNDGNTIINEPLVNDDGVRKLTGLLESVANMHYIMADHSINEAFNNIIDYTSVSIVRTLLANKNKFGIKDLATSNIINDAFMLKARGIVARGLGERGFWTKTFQEYNIHSQPQKKEGILSGLFKRQ